MFTIIVAIACGVGLEAALELSGAASRGWAIFFGVVLMLALQMTAGFLVRKKVNRVNGEIQNMMAQMQARLTRKVEAFQRRPSGNIKLIQQELQDEQYSAIRRSLVKLNELNPVTKWSPMLSKQLDTMRMVMYFQLREFDKVDKLMKNSMMLTAQAIAIKLTRMFKLEDPKLDRFFAKKSKRLKGDDAALIYSLYAWIKLKQDDPKAALDALNASIKKSDSPVLLANRDRIANGKLKQFSNAQLGDAWYGLYLEEPKIRQQRVAERRFQ